MEKEGKKASETRRWRSCSQECWACGEMTRMFSASRVPVHIQKPEWGGWESMWMRVSHTGCILDFNDKKRTKKTHSPSGMRTGPKLWAFQFLSPRDQNYPLGWRERNWEWDLKPSTGHATPMPTCPPSKRERKAWIQSGPGAKACKVSSGGGRSLTRSSTEPPPSLCRDLRGTNLSPAFTLRIPPCFSALRRRIHSGPRILKFSSRVWRTVNGEGFHRSVPERSREAELHQVSSEQDQQQQPI